MIELLRFFAEEKPELHVVAAGPLFEAKKRPGLVDSDWSSGKFEPFNLARVDQQY